MVWPSAQQSKLVQITVATYLEFNILNYLSNQIGWGGDTHGYQKGKEKKYIKSIEDGKS